ncbi:hypothetical protein C2S52_018558 [Perilla frutescens var. hirtella]|nr:hypothetical protein C2S52_018558 [Perilla frutescens var. hirtella]
MLRMLVAVDVVLKRNSNDVGWNYAILVDAKNMDKVQCINLLSSGKSKLREQNINDAFDKQRSTTLDSWKLLVESIGQYGPGYVPPTRYDYTVPLLNKEIDRTKDLLKTHETEWRLNGCSIMTDVIFEYVDQCIDQDNVVQIVTDNVSNNMGAAKLLKEKRPTIFWTSCVAHTIDLMLESIAKQSRFKKAIDQARALTIFLYAHHKVLTMMSVKGKAAYTIVVSLTFWSGIASCLEVFTPLIKVLWIADSDRKLSMGFVYGELVQAKEDIKIAEHSIPKNYEPIIEVIDTWIKDRLNSPLYLTAYVLNPFYHYKNPFLHLKHDVAIGMIECVDILFPGDVDLQDKILNEEFPKYRDKESLFGKPVVVKGCSLNDARFDPGTYEKEEWIGYKAT